MSTDDESLIRSFQDRTLGLEAWNQRTHVEIAFLYLQAHGFSEALRRLRIDIQAFNAHHQIEEGLTSGYNETTTVALLRLVDSVRVSYGSVFPVSSAKAFCDTHPQLMSKHVLRFFYSPERRMHPEAKTRFIEPDLAPLPNVPGHDEEE